MQGMTEPLAIEPVHSGPIRDEGRGGGRLGANLKADAIVGDGQAVGQVIDLVHIGDDNGDFIALLDGEFFQPEIGRHGYHIDPHFVAVANQLIVFFQHHTVFFRHCHGIGEHGVAAGPDFVGIDDIRPHDNTIVGFSEGRPVVYDLHFIRGDIDELLVLRLQRTHVEKAILGKLVQ